jgi:hypothetical protein
MSVRLSAIGVALWWLAAFAQAQQSGTPGSAPDGAAPWKTASGAAAETRTAASSGLSLTPGGLDKPAARITQVNKGSGTLPNDHGQVWREYDISPYTSRVNTTEKPEQAIVDWILRETGTEVWFSEPLGLLNASKTSLRVYHTPEMHRLILDVVDRFVSSQAESQAITLRLVTIGSPNWRATALPLLQPIGVKSAGVDAWLLSKENAAVLLAQLRKRTDYREHNSPSVLVQNGQSHTVTRTTPRNFVRSVRLRPDVWPGHELDMGQLQEGYSLQISPLMALDGTAIDAVIKCQIDQIEKLVSVAIDVPSVGGGTQRVQIQVPQVVSWRLHERFRWPAEQVLLLSCGVVAAPTPERTGPLGMPLPPIPALPLGGSGGRADAILFVESKGKAAQTLLEAKRDTRSGTPNYSGRY